MPGSPRETPLVDGDKMLVRLPGKTARGHRQNAGQVSRGRAKMMLKTCIWVSSAEEDRCRSGMEQGGNS